MTVYADHSTMRAILNSPNPSGKYVNLWTKVYGWGIKDVKIQYRLEKLNANADALSRCPHKPASETGLADGEVQVAVVSGG